MVTLLQVAAVVVAGTGLDLGQHLALDPVGPDRLPQCCRHGRGQHLLERVLRAGPARTCPS